MCILRQHLTTAIVVFIFSHVVYSGDSKCKADLESRNYSGRFSSDKAMGLNPNRLDGFYVVTYILTLEEYNEDGKHKSGNNDDPINWNEYSSIELFCNGFSKDLTATECHAALNEKSLTGDHAKDVVLLKQLMQSGANEYVSVYNSLITVLSTLKHSRELRFDFDPRTLLCDGKVSNAEGKLHFDKIPEITQDSGSKTKEDTTEDSQCKAELKKRNYNGTFRSDKALAMNSYRLDGFFTLTYELLLEGFNEDGTMTPDYAKKYGETITPIIWSKVNSLELFCRGFSRELTAKDCHETLDLKGFTGEYEKDDKLLRPLMNNRKEKNEYYTIYNSLLSKMLTLKKSRELQFDFNSKILLCDGKVSNNEGILHYGPVPGSEKKAEGSEL